MIRRPTRATLTDTLVPCTTLFRSRLIRPPEKSQLCGIAIYAKACAEGSCNLNYKKEQERGNRKLGMSESTLCQMERSSPRERRHSDIIDRSDEHTSELQSLMRISHADSCLIITHL